MVQIKREWFDTEFGNYERGKTYGRCKIYFKRNLICYSTWQCRVRERVKMSVKTKVSKCVALSWHFNLAY